MEGKGHLKDLATDVLIYNLFKDVFIHSYYIISREIMMLNKELGRLWKEAAVAQLNTFIIPAFVRTVCGKTRKPHVSRAGLCAEV